MAGEPAPPMDGIAKSRELQPCVRSAIEYVDGGVPRLTGEQRFAGTVDVSRRRAIGRDVDRTVAAPADGAVIGVPRPPATRAIDAVGDLIGPDSEPLRTVLQDGGDGI